MMAKIDGCAVNLFLHLNEIYVTKLIVYKMLLGYIDVIE